MSNIFVLLVLEILWGIIIKIESLSNVATILGVPSPSHHVAKLNIATIVNPLHKHAHFSHILVCVTHFLVIICFNKKHHSLESLSHLLVAQNICKAFLINVTIIGQILGFCKLYFPLAMLMLLCSCAN